MVCGLRTTIIASAIWRCPKLHGLRSKDHNNNISHLAVSKTTWACDLQTTIIAHSIWRCPTNLLFKTKNTFLLTRNTRMTKVGNEIKFRDKRTFGQRVVSNSPPEGAPIMARAHMNKNTNANSCFYCSMELLSSSG